MVPVRFGLGCKKNEAGHGSTYFCFGYKKKKLDSSRVKNSDPFYHVFFLTHFTMSNHNICKKKKKKKKDNICKDISNVLSSINQVVKSQCH